jgi:hypothetical protein
LPGLLIHAPPQPRFRGPILGVSDMIRIVVISGGHLLLTGRFCRGAQILRQPNIGPEMRK